MVLWSGKSPSRPEAHARTGILYNGLNAHERAQKGHFDIPCPPRLRARASAVALGQSEAGPRRTLQPGPPRGACAESCPRSAGGVEADQRAFAGRPTRRQRGGAAGCLPRERQDDRRRTRNHPGGGMAGRQLSSRRKADPRNPIGSAAGILPTATQADRRAISGIPARFRRGVGLCRPQRQPLRSRGPVPLRTRVSTDTTPDDRRTLGGCDHIADRPR